MTPGSTRHRIARVVITAVAVTLFSSRSAFACPVCFGAEEAHIIDATQLGMVMLLGITLSVQGGFVGFFLYLRKRAKQNADVELDMEWSDLQRGSR